MKKFQIINIFVLLFFANLNAQSLCQQQLEMNNTVSGFGIGQSIFMSDCNGFFSSIELNRSDDGPELTAELIIFTGQTSIGAPRYSQNVTIPQGIGTFTIEFGSGEGTLAFFEESQYAFILSNPALQLEASSDINSYANGQMFIDVGFINNDDLWFKLNTTTSLGIREVEMKNPSLFPNPVIDILQLSGIGNQESFKIFNVLGTEVMKGIVDGNENIDVQNLPLGLYYLRLNNGQTLKFIKK